MLDDLSIDVGHVKRSVRTGGEEHWAKPIVATAQKLAFLPHALGGEARANWFEPVVMNEIAGRVAGKCMAVIVIRQAVGPIDMDGASGCEGACMTVRRGDVGAD